MNLYNMRHHSLVLVLADHSRIHRDEYLSLKLHKECASSNQGSAMKDSHALRPPNNKEKHIDEN